MPSARTWWKGAKAALAARTDAAPAGDIVTTTDGDAFVGDGTTLFPNLARLTKSSDPGVPVVGPILEIVGTGELVDQAELDPTARSADISLQDGTKYLPRVRYDRLTEPDGSVTALAPATQEINGVPYESVEYDSAGLAAAGKRPDATQWFARLATDRLECYWTGKKVVVVGTSITEGYNAPVVNGTRTGFVPRALRVDIGMILDNQGVASSGIVWTGTRALSLGATRAELTAAGFDPNESYETRLLGKNADLYIFDHGYNDRGSTLGTIDGTDPATFYGAFNRVLGALIAEKPTAQIILITPPSLYTDNGLPLAYNANTAAKRDAIKALGEKYAAPVLDMSARVQLSAVQGGAFMTDLIHPSDAAHVRMARQLAAFVRGI